MNSDWKERSVSELERTGALLVQDGNHGNDRPRPDEFASAGTAFIRAGDLAGGCVLLDQASRINDVAHARIRKGRGLPGDVLLSHKGTVGRVGLVPSDAPPFVCSPQTTFWRALDSEVINRRFLLFFLRSPAFVRQLTALKGQTDMADYVSLTDQRQMTITLPPIPEQRRIAGVLGALDDKIEHNTTRALREAELLSGAFRASFSALSVVDEDVPAGWRAGVLGDEVEVVMGQSPPGSTYTYDSSVGLPLIQGNADLGDRYPEPTRHTTTPTRASRVGDVIFTVRAPVGEVNISDGEFCLGRGVAAIRSDLPVYAEQLVRALASRWSAEETGTIFPSVNRSQILGLPITRPPKVAAEEFDLTYRSLYDSIAELHSETRTLAAIRDAVLPRLVAGSIRVSESFEPRELKSAV